MLRAAGPYISFPGLGTPAYRDPSSLPPVHTLQGMGWEFEWDSAAHCGQFSLLLLRLSEMPGLIQRMYCAALLGLTNVRTKFLSSLDTASSLHNTAYPLTTSVILKCEAR